MKNRPYTAKINKNRADLFENDEAKKKDEEEENKEEKEVEEVEEV